MGVIITSADFSSGPGGGGSATLTDVTGNFGNPQGPDGAEGLSPGSPFGYGDWLYLYCAYSGGIGTNTDIYWLWSDNTWVDVSGGVNNLWPNGGKGITAPAHGMIVLAKQWFTFAPYNLLPITLTVKGKEGRALGGFSTDDTYGTVVRHQHPSHEPGLGMSMFTGSTWQPYIGGPGPVLDPMNGAPAVGHPAICTFFVDGPLTLVDNAKIWWQLTTSNFIKVGAYHGGNPTGVLPHGGVTTAQSLFSANVFLINLATFTDFPGSQLTPNPAWRARRVRPTPQPGKTFDSYGGVSLL